MPLNADHIFPAAPPFLAFPSRRSVVHSTNGIVACTQPLATAAGVRILEAGGNAADAAVAVAAALGVTEPSSTGIGGDCFCLYYDAKTRSVQGLNGSGRSPRKLSLEQVRQEAKSGDVTIPFGSVNAVTVPGAAAGWVDTIKRWGSGKVGLREVLAPAIELAEGGFPVSELAAYNVSTSGLYI